MGPADEVSIVAEHDSPSPNDMGRAPGLLEYQASHRGLMTCIEGLVPTASQGLGLVAVPTCKPLTGQLPGLRLAAEVAISQRCPLLVVCSGDAAPAQFPPDLAEALGSLLVLVEMKSVPNAWWPQLASIHHELAGLERSNDVGLKRNLALRVAATAGLDTVLFIDDDIVACPDTGDRRGETLDVVGVERALGALVDEPGIHAVGWSCEGSAHNALPSGDKQSWVADHSVVGHARRLVALPQKTFIGGGALLVRVGARTPFFPDIYNEDWLFLLAIRVAAGTDCVVQPLARAGRVLQFNVHPFTVERARGQEAGDTCGEVLMNLVEAERLEVASDVQSWREAIEGRGKLIDELRDTLATHFRPGASPVPGIDPDLDEDSARWIDGVLGNSRAVNRRLDPAMFVDYLKVYDCDLDTWREHLESDLAGPVTTAPLNVAALIAAGPVADLGVRSLT